MGTKGIKGTMRVSAPGKIILFGEHSVVYGKRALAVSLGLRTELTLSDAKDGVSLHLPEIDVDESYSLERLKTLWESLRRNRGQRLQQPHAMTDEEEETLKSFLGIKQSVAEKRELGLLAFFHLYMTILPYPQPFSISVKSEMPVSAGLGSSAAYAVCLSAVLLYLAGDIDPIELSEAGKGEEKDCMKKVCEWALCCEKIIHGKPSGIDNTVCTYGGAVSFKSGKVDQLVPPTLRVLLVNTCVTRNTKALVARVKNKYTSHESIIEPILTSLDEVAQSAVDTMKTMKANGLSSDSLRTKIDHLYELVDINHCLLSALGVSHLTLDRIVAIAKSHGLHAKLTGAGGGGFAFVLLSPDVSQDVINVCTNDFNKEGFQTWVTCLGGDGLKMTSSK